MGLFFLRFWPVLIPLLVYAIWMRNMRARARKTGEPIPDFRDGPWFWALIASLSIAVIIFLFLGLGHEENRGTYVPPHMENGKIIPGEIK